MIAKSSNRYDCNQFIKIACLVILSLTVSIISCSKKADDGVLAEFDDGVVMQNEYIDHYLLSTQYKPDKFPTEENLKEIVRLKAMEKMTVLEAKERKLYNDSLYKALTNKNENRILFYEYTQKNIINKVVTDSLINKFYAEYTPQYRMRYILRPVLQTSSDEFEKSQKDTIDLVHRRLESGQKFEKLAARYSQDITTNKKGGDLGFVIRESLGDAKIRAVMDTLTQFTYSKPFRGFEGYYILYKGKKRDVPVPPLSKIKGKIWNTLYRTRRHVVKQVAREQFEKLVPQYNYRIHQPAIDKIKRLAGGDENTSEFKMLDFRSIDPTDLNEVLAEFDGGEIKAYRIFENEKKAPDTMHGLRERLLYLSQQAVFAAHARDLGMHENPEIAKQLEQMKNSVLHSILYHKAVKQKAEAMIAALESTKPDSQKQYFDIEKNIKNQFEAELKDKYHFEYNPENFSIALEKARDKKEVQNRERAAEKAQ